MDNKNKPKRKKYKFARQQSKILKKLGRSGWHAPKGMHSKLRRKKKGKGLLPTIGYSSSRKDRGLTRHGLIQTMVSEQSQLSKLDNKHGIIISKSVGTRKRLELLRKIKELKLKVLNIKDVDDYIKTVEDRIKSKKELKQKKDEKKKVLKEEALKKVPEVSKTDETEEEKQKREKEEKRKVLEQK